MKMKNTEKTKKEWTRERESLSKYLNGYRGAKNKKKLDFQLIFNKLVRK